MAGSVNSKPVLAFDMDEVIYPFAEQIFAHYSQVLNEEVDHSILDDYHGFHRLWGIDESQTLKRIINFFQTDTHHEAVPVMGSKEVLHRLDGRFRIIIVTARQHVAENATRQWLSAHFNDVIDEVYFCNFFSDDGTPPISKSLVCQSEDADLFVDDSPKNVGQVVDSGTESLLFGDYSWNRHSPNKYQRIKNWTELESCINERF